MCWSGMNGVLIPSGDGIDQIFDVDEMYQGIDQIKDNAAMVLIR